MMDVRQPGIQTMTASDARQNFASVLNRVFREETRVVVEKSGIPVAAIVSTEDLRWLDQLDHERAERRKIVAEMRAAFKDIPPEEIEREAARSVAQVRAEQHGEINQSAESR